MTTFESYRDGPGGKIAKTILGKSIKDLTSWRAFSDLVYDTCGPKMLDRAERVYADGHIGERAVILATLFAMDYSGQAVKLGTNAGENLLGLMNYVDTPHRLAVAACLVFGD